RLPWDPLVPYTTLFRSGGERGGRGGRPDRQRRRGGLLARPAVPGVRGDAGGGGCRRPDRALLALRHRARTGGRGRRSGSRGRLRAAEGAVQVASRRVATSSRRGREAAVGQQQLAADPGALRREQEPCQVRDGLRTAELAARGLRRA